jgi:ankyrin repeat protein
VLLALLAAGAWQPVFSAPVVASQQDALEPVRTQLRLKNFTRAAELLKVQADHQEATAQYLLGTLYRSGLGVPVDLKQARQLIEAAAMHGNADAAYALAAMLADEPTPDAAAIKQWLQRAADAGHTLARKALTDGLLPQRFQPEKSLRDADARRGAFWTAAAQDDVALLRLLNAPDLINAKDVFGRTALSHAAKQGAQAAVTWLVQAGASADSADSFGITPLMLAASTGEQSAGEQTVIQQLLAAGAPLNNKDHVSNTALMYAAGTGHSAVAMQLLTAGADINATNAQGWSALDWAIRTNSPELVAKLRSLGLTTARKASIASSAPSLPFQHANANTDLYRGWPDLLIAATRSPELVSNVIKLNSNVTQRGPNGETALLVAVQSGNTAVIDKLLAGGVITNAADTGDSPLSWAVRHDKFPLVQLLLSKGIKPDTHSKTEAAPVLDAVRQNNDAMLAALLKAGAGTEVRDSQGRTPLMWAAQLNYTNQLNALLNSGADPNASDKQGRSALWLASANGATECLRTLINAKAKLETRDSNNSTALMAAATKGQAGSVELLLAAGASTQAPSNGNTALMLAAANGQEGIVKRLLGAGARPDVQNKYGDTALMFAARAGHVEVTRSLLAAGASAELRNKDRASVQDIANRLGFKELAALLAKGA